MAVSINSQLGVLYNAESYRLQDLVNSVRTYTDSTCEPTVVHECCIKALSSAVVAQSYRLAVNSSAEQTGAGSSVRLEVVKNVWGMKEKKVHKLVVERVEK